RRWIPDAGLLPGQSAKSRLSYVRDTTLCVANPDAERYTKCHSHTKRYAERDSERHANAKCYAAFPADSASAADASLIEEQKLQSSKRELARQLASSLLFRGSFAGMLLQQPPAIAGIRKSQRLQKSKNSVDRFCRVPLKLSVTPGPPRNQNRQEQRWNAPGVSTKAT